MPTKATPMGEDHPLGSIVWNLDLGSDRVRAVADIDRRSFRYLGCVRVVDIAVVRLRHLRARSEDNFESYAVIQGKSLAFARLEVPQPDQLLELVRVLRGEIVALGAILVRIVEFPGVLRVIAPAGDRRVRGDRFPTLVPDAARPQHRVELGLPGRRLLGVVKARAHAHALNGILCIALDHLGRFDTYNI